jgi:hypothetical protein
MANKPPIGPSDLKPLMYWAGLSLHACQQLEYSVKFLLVVMAEVGFGGISMREAVAIIEDQDKKTLGQLLNLLKQRVTISKGWSSALQAGLEARNEVIHRFLIENVERTVDPITRPEVLAALKQLRKTVLAGDQAVREIIETLSPLLPFDFAAMTRRLDEEVRARNVKQ